MGTVFCYNRVSTNGLKYMKMVTQVLRMRKEPVAHPQPQIRTLHGSVRQVTFEVASHLWIMHGSAHEIIHNRLWFHSVCVRLVPKQLTMFINEHPSTFYPPPTEKEPLLPQTHWIGVWVGPESAWMIWRNKYFLSYWDSNFDHLIT
jgi:hypothetical protein